jgi:nitrate reductase alpha subunit
VITSPEWWDRGLAAAAMPVHGQRRTAQALAHLTGRMHFFLDHDWMRDLGETCRPIDAAGCIGFR